MSPADCRYPVYKDTGVPWLGEIPAHWEVVRLKHVSSITLSSVDKHSREDEIPVRLCNYADVYAHEVISSDMEFMQATATPSEIGAFTLRKGDILITKDSETWDDIAVPAYVAHDMDGVLCGYHLAQIRPEPRRVESKYLFWSLSAKGPNHQFVVATNGITRYGLSKHWIDNGLIPLPPLPEQRAIAEYLDDRTARIDALVDRYRRLIALLRECRAALITHAVTRGLDPSAPLKDSGVPWLGEIPAHWEVVRLKWAAELERIITAEPPENCRYVGLEHVQSWIGRLTDDGDDDFEPQGSCLLFDSRHVLFGKLRPYLAKALAPDFAGCCSSEFLVMLPRLVVRKFLLYYLLSVPFVRIVDSSTFGAKMPRANWDLVGAMSLPVPPVHEQRAIAEYLDGQTARIDAAVARAERMIAILQEYRAALITAAVTGRIRVT